MTTNDGYANGLKRGKGIETLCSWMRQDDLISVFVLISLGFGSLLCLAVSASCDLPFRTFYLSLSSSSSSSIFIVVWLLQFNFMTMVLLLCVLSG